MGKTCVMVQKDRAQFPLPVKSATVPNGIPQAARLGLWGYGHCLAPRRPAPVRDGDGGGRRWNPQRHGTTHRHRQGQRQQRIGEMCNRRTAAW
jgi:hypothetical protein